MYQLTPTPRLPSFTLGAVAEGSFSGKLSARPGLLEIMVRQIDDMQHDKRDRDARTVMESSEDRAWRRD